MTTCALITIMCLASTALAGNIPDTPKSFARSVKLHIVETRAADKFLRSLSSDRKYAAQILAAAQSPDQKVLITLIARGANFDPKQITILALDPDFHIKIKFGRWTILCIDTTGDRCSD